MAPPAAASWLHAALVAPAWLGEPLRGALQPQLDALAAQCDKNPVHVAVEAVLLLFIAYILLAKRSYDPQKKGYGGRKPTDLGDLAREELLSDWEPEPLVPREEADEGADAEDAAYAASGALVASEAARDAGLPYIVSSFGSGGGGGSRGAAPADFVHGVLVEGDARPKVSFTSQDFLGLGSDAAVKAQARETLERYTVGSCGPRGFYGTTRKHLELEDDIAAFMRKDQSITYSDATATIASAIPAFAKRGDVLLIDARANYGIMAGARLSRSSIVKFRHNDLEDLRNKLLEVRSSDERANGTAARSLALLTRRFIVVEGLYANTGDLCPLDAIEELAREFKWRIIVDDSWGFGVLGPTGRGVTEHFGKEPAAGAPSRERELLHVEVLVGSLSTTLASVGGFCVGSREVVDHQRLSGQGYCFSASAPPFTCATAAAALSAMASSGSGSGGAAAAAGRLAGGGPELLARLRAKSELAQRELAAALGNRMRLTSDPISPIKHLVLLPLTGGADAAAPLSLASSRLSGSAGSSSLTSPQGGFAGGGRRLPPRAGAGAAPPLSARPSKHQLEREAARERAREERLLDRVVLEACARGVLVSRSHGMSADAAAAPSLRVMVTVLHSDEDLRALARALKEAVGAVLADATSQQ